MAIGAIWSPPIDAATYDAVKERVMQAAIDAGSRFHAAGPSPSGWRSSRSGTPRRASTGSFATPSIRSCRR
jgi:hypothetical protein